MLFAEHCMKSGKKEKLCESKQLTVLGLLTLTVKGLPENCSWLPLPSFTREDGTPIASEGKDQNASVVPTECI